MNLQSVHISDLPLVGMKLPCQGYVHSRYIFIIRGMLSFTLAALEDEQIYKPAYHCTEVWPPHLYVAEVSFVSAWIPPEFKSLPFWFAHCKWAHPS